MLDHLNRDGKILIGDVAFETRAEMDRCRQVVGDAWGDEESYFVVDELRRTFPHLSFTRVSSCSGIIALSR